MREHDVELNESQREPQPRSRYTVDSVRAYLNTIGDIPLLDLEQEIALMQGIEAGRAADKELGALDEADAPNDFERRHELQATAQYAQQARDKMILANQRLVVSIARGYIGTQRDNDFPDIVLNGIIGLIKAVDSHDYRKGKFSTIANYWIRKHIIREQDETGRSVRVPVHQWDKARKVTTARRELRAALGREPTLDEIAQQIAVPLDKLEEALNETQPVLSMQQTVLDASGRVYFGEEDYFDEHVASPEDITMERMRLQTLGRALVGLSTRERDVVVRRYGLNGHEPQLLSDIAAEDGVSRPMVAKILARALARLREQTF